MFVEKLKNLFRSDEKSCFTLKRQSSKLIVASSSDIFKTLLEGSRSQTVSRSHFSRQRPCYAFLALPNAPLGSAQVDEPASLLLLLIIFITFVIIILLNFKPFFLSGKGALMSWNTYSLTEAAT